MAEKFVSISVDELVKRGARIVSPEELAEREQKRSDAPPALPPRPGSRDPFVGQINEAEAERLGLERVKLQAFPEAQDLMARIFDRTRADAIDIGSAAGRELFFVTWLKSCPDLPPPCVLCNSAGTVLPDQTGTVGVNWSKSDFWYLTQLQAGKIMSNLDKDNPIPAYPSFDKQATLFVMGWQEGDYYQATSPLLKELLRTESVVNISRESLDAALWEGDPSAKTKTRKHAELIKNLGLNPNNYNFRLIAQDEYARLASTKNFGSNYLFTMYNNYVLEGVVAYGLYGGARKCGSVSYVGNDSRDEANSNVAVRLVLECTA